ncbi:MAG: type II secretion system F family protein [Mycobacteriales bacterium]|nr:MAG: type II secretion system protein [Pseudonocardiales bacterium]
MGSDGLLALIAGALAGGGVLLLISALMGRQPIEGEDSRPPLLAGSSSSDLVKQAGIAVVAGLLVFVITGWIVATAAAAVLGFFFRSLVGGARAARVEMKRLEELASWTESLRDTIAGAVGLEQAIPVSVNAAGPAIRPNLMLLVDRLRTREPLADALLKFAADLDDPSADLILAALILNARLRGPGLRDVLGALSQAAREELDMRGRIEASRRSTRRSVQIIVAVSAVVILGVTVLSPNYVSAYNDLVGQLILLVVFGLFTVGLLWLRGLAAYEVPERFLTSQSAVPAALRLREPA